MIGLAGANDFDRRQEQTFLKQLGRLTPGAARHGTAHIRLMRDTGGKSDEVAFVKNRCDQCHIRHVGQVPLIGVIADQRIAVSETVLAVYFEDPADEMKIDRAVKKHRRRDGEASLAVGDDAAEIAGFTHDCRISRAVEPVIHFFHQAGDAAAKDLDGYGVWTRHVSILVSVGALSGCSEKSRLSYQRLLRHSRHPCY